MLAPKQQIKKEQAASYLGLSLSTLNRLIKAGKLTPLRVSPKIVYFTQDDLDLYLQSTKTLTSEKQ